MRNGIVVIEDIKNTTDNEKNENHDMKDLLV
jgi:hypothetical protein